MTRRVTFRRCISAVILGVGMIGAGILATSGGASASAGPRAAAAAQASITPSNNIGNEQTVTVSWSGFTQTALDPKHLPGAPLYRDLVGLYECVANPTGGHYYYMRDCYTQLPPNDNVYPGDGNMIDPERNDYGIWGVTGPNGEGQIGFQVQEGTLHSSPPTLDYPRTTTPIQPWNIQCDQTHACVLKVVDFGTSFEKYPFYAPNFPGSRLTAGDWTELADAAPSIPLAFAPIPSCPPPAANTPQLNVEGAGSSSYAINAWNGQLCNSRTPLNLNYTTTGEGTAKGDFQSGAADVALASLPPSSGPSGGSYIAAPVDVTGVAIAFRIADQIAGTTVTTVRLTPRLVAMLITDSGTDGGFSYIDSAQIYALTGDPEFQALNPGVTFPGLFGQYGVIEPILEGAATDDTQILTQWIADDADAMAFLHGHDPCGVKLNPNWSGVSYPTPILRDLEQDSRFPNWSGYYNPITNLGQEVTDLIYGKPAGFNPINPSLGQQAMPPVAPTEDAMFAELDATTATRAAEPAASLSAAHASSTIGQFVTVTSPGHCTPKSLTSFPGFTAPSAGSLALALGTMAQNRDHTLQPPLTTNVDGAYPLTKVDYAFMPSSNLTRAKAQALAQFVDYVAGPGQSSTVLPYGYSPLPAFLAAQDTNTAAAILRSVPSSPGPPGTTPGTTTTTSGPGSGSVPGSSHPGSNPAASGSTAGGTSASRSSGSSGGTATTKPVGGQAAQGQPPGDVASAAAAVGERQTEGPVSIGAIERNGWWLLPLIIGLVLVMGLGGALLGWDIPLSPRRRRQAP
jgi:hypothetical protein